MLDGRFVRDPSMPLLREELAKPRGEPGLVEPLFGDGDHGVVKRRLIRTRLNAVQAQERVRCGDRCSLVSVEERLVLRNVKCVRGGDVEHIAATIPIRVLRGGERRLNESFISHAAQPSEAPDRFSVQFREHLAADKLPFHGGLFSELAKEPFVFREDLLADDPCLLGIGVTDGRLFAERFSCGQTPNEFRYCVLLGRRKRFDLLDDFGGAHAAKIKARRAMARSAALATATFTRRSQKNTGPAAEWPPTPLFPPEQSDKCAG